MAADTRIYRSDDASIAGVCAGIAERFGLDAAAVRILALLLVPATLGIVVLAYAVLWLVLPKHVSMAPETVLHAVYVPAAPHAAVAPARPARGQAPVPPIGYAAAGACATPASGSASVHAAEKVRLHPSAACGGSPAGPSGFVRAVVWAGLAALTMTLAFALAGTVSELRWWQFLPVAICLAGLAFMMLPSRRVSRAKRVALGVSLLAVGVFVLAMSTGVMAWATAGVAVEKLWPGALVVAGLVIVGAGLRDDLFYLAAAACVVVLCLAAMAGFGQPGPVEALSVQSPFGPPRELFVNPWR